MFPKDILIIDFEPTLGGSADTQPAQIGAILLDKDTLKEKKSFTSFIKIDLSKVTSEQLAKKEFTVQELENAPEQKAVAKQFLDVFGKDYFLSSWVADLDIQLFKRIMGSANIPFSEFDFHVYDLWPLAYTYLLQKGYTGHYGSEDMFGEFGLPPRGIHDALEDCRYAAQVLRLIRKTN